MVWSPYILYFLVQLARWLFSLGAEDEKGLFYRAAKQVGCRACLTQDSPPQRRRKGCHLEGVLQGQSKSIPTTSRDSLSLGALVTVLTWRVNSQAF